MYKHTKLVGNGNGDGAASSINLLKSDGQRQQHTYNYKYYFLFTVVILVVVLVTLLLTVVKQLKRDLTTDLQLGLSLSPSAASQRVQRNPSQYPSAERGRASEKNLIGSVIQKMNAATADDEHNDVESSSSSRNTRRRLYVKVYMEGHAIGRKLDLLAHHGFHDMIRTLEHMFNTNILWGDDVDRVHSGHYELHVLTYEDEEGDWLIVGDVPWEMFLSAAKRLKITRTFP
ncbi:auxin-responsive protein IAA30-like [Pyrus communis]|uniref:auxin-responsive protein IAA30-like n=1 Tax=Pyrus communis TaxID=23211 RepID=UPI0035C02555